MIGFSAYVLLITMCDFVHVAIHISNQTKLEIRAKKKISLLKFKAVGVLSFKMLLK